jgi:hypothetical protein
MKFILLPIFLMLSGLCFAQSASQKKIVTLLENQSAAWNKGDLEGFMKGYWENDSLQFIGKSGVTYGWKNTLANYKKGYPNKDAMGQLHFDILSIKKLSCKYQRVVGKWSLKRTIGNVGGHFTLLFKKVKGEWVIIADHSS